MDRPFVGRRRELAALAGLLADARAGTGAAAIISGEAGMGKSTLLAEALRLAREAGVPVLLGRASADEGAPVFWPWTRLLTGAAAAGLGLDVGLLDLGADGPVGTEPRPAARFQAIARCTDALLTAARPAGLVLAVEDAHWADGPSLHLLDHLCRELGAESLLVLVTTRPPLPATLADVATVPGVHRLDLAPLGRADIAAYLGAGTDPSWPAVLHRHCGGHPLFLHELARLLDAPTLRAPAGEAPPAPAGLQRVVAHRLGALSAGCRDLLGTAAACGDEVAVSLLYVDAAAPDAAIAEAVAAGVLLEDPAEPGTLRWSHPVVRATWYESLPRADRVRRHTQLAARLAMGAARPGEVARHRVRAAVDGPSRAVAAAACAAAAADASARLAFDEAGDWLATALPLLDDAGEQAENRLAQARAAYRDGQVVAALDHAEAVVAVAERLNRADLAAAGATVVTGIQGPTSASVAGLCARARGLLGDEETPRHAQVLAQQALALADAYDAEAAAPLSRRAWELAARGEDPDALLAAARARLMLSGRPEEVHERLALIARLREVATTANRPDLELWAHLWRIEEAHRLGAIAEVDAEIFALTHLVDRVGWPIARWHLLRARSSRALLVGRFAECEALALEFREVARRTQDFLAQAMFVALMGQLLAEVGRFADHPPDPVLLAAGEGNPAFHASHGLFQARAGDLDGARHNLDRLRPMLPTMPVDARWAPSVYMGAQLATVLGDTEPAAWCYAALQGYGAYYFNGAAGCGGAGHVTLGGLAAVLGRPAEAIAHLLDGIAMERRIGALPGLARAQLTLAQVRAARGAPGDRDAAARLLEDCLDVARRLGMAPTVATAERLAAELAGHAVGPAALTAREREIAGLVAAGRSNRDIAEHLVLSERTVETHVRNVLTKLGLANRTQVASWAIRTGLQ